ncbi:MAG TPA: HD domain-containing phosphohydrolase [Nitrospirota bacterium]|nr:HD domain-containing phosphohydrolase [Nitrospirota bacterium]
MPKKTLPMKRMMFSIASLVDLGQEATSTKELAEKMKAALYVIAGTFSVTTAALFAFNRQRKNLFLLASKGRRDGSLQAVSRLDALSTHLKSFKINEPHSYRDLQQNAFFKANRTTLMNLQMRIFLPLFAKGDFVGALILGSKLGNTKFRQADKALLRVIAHQMAITLHNNQLFLDLSKKAEENKRLYHNMQHIYQDTIQAFAAAIDAKDGYTKDHSYRVASYAVAIAKELGWSKRDQEGIYVAGLLHDIGKIIIDTRVIQKGEKLTLGEIDQIRKHPEISYDILSKIKFPWKNIDFFVRHHHERVDGRGYPDALSEEELSEGVKILALADAFDAMTTDRPYRDKLGLSETFQEVMNGCGTQFDEKITKIFFNMLLRELSGEVKEPQILPLLHRQEAVLSEVPSLGATA